LSPKYQQTSLAVLQDLKNLQFKHFKLNCWLSLKDSMIFVGLGLLFMELKKSRTPESRF